MQNFILSWYNFWNKRKGLFVLSLVAILGLFFWASTNLTIHQDITKTLPNSAEFEEFKQLIEHKGLNNRFVLSVTPDSINDFDATLEHVDSVIQQIKKSTKERIFDLNYEVNDEDEELIKSYYNNLPFFVNDSLLNYKDGKLNKKELISKLQKNHERLHSYQSFFLKDFIFNDPMGLLPPILKDLEILKSNFASTVEDGVLMTQDGNGILVVGKCSANMKDSKAIIEIADSLESIKSSWKSKGFEVDYFTGILIAAANAKQVKKDTSLTITLTISAIIFILLIYYRNVLIPILFMIPAIFGMGLSLAVVSLTRGEISGISIGAGAIIIGVIMDYSFHFFSHLKHVKDIKSSLKDITLPLVTGSLTTVLAFVALLFTNSKILQDFGLFASVSLVGAMGTVLFIMPLIIPNGLFKKVKEKIDPSKPRKFKFLGLAIGLGIIGFTIFSITKIDEFEFETELDHLSYHPESLKQSERKLFGKDPLQDKRIYVFAKHKDQNAASELNRQVFHKLKSLYQRKEINSFVSTGFFDLPKSEQRANLEQWNVFWNPENKKQLCETLDSMSLVLGYTEKAFDSFKYLVEHTNIKLDPAIQNVYLHQTLSESLIDTSDGTFNYISSFLIDKDNRDLVKSELMTIPGIRIFDNNSLTNSLVSLVSDDFNFILWVSSGLVLIVLLIVYGRIELALATFIPMVLSWLWIIGLTVLFDIKFNFVNVIITTFIFGLGDDFAIFISDAYLSKYKTGVDKMSSYKKSILLSSLTTIIGTGVLYFAKHPAIHSIGLLSVIGMISIVIISFTVQPFLYKFFLIKRAEKGKAPLTLFGFTVSIFAFTFFLVGCIILFLIHLLLRIIPFGQKQLKLLFHSLLQVFTWLQVHVMINVRKQIIGKEKLDFSQPKVIIANHQSFIDILSVISLNKRIVIMTNDWVYNSPFFGSQIRYAGFLQASKGIEANLEAIKKLVSNGYSIVIFPEGTRSKDATIKRFHKGAFYLSQQLKMDIVPLLLHGYNDTMEKNDFLLKNGRMTIKVLDTIKHDDPKWGETYQARSKAATKYYREQMAELDEAQKTPEYLFPKVLSNYIYKGPELEWYVRIKWLFERKNYAYYHSLIKGYNKVYDIGCGLGYLSYYLKYKNPKTEVVGMDYDAEKIEIAQNCYSKTEGINFFADDINSFEIENADAIFCMDILHYLTPEQQDSVLKKCVNALNTGGTLIIRDGVSDYQERHNKTKKTEKYSTQIIKFNKTVNDLHFFNKDYITKFAHHNQLTIEIKEQSDKTSNVLFILKKS